MKKITPKPLQYQVRTDYLGCIYRTQGLKQVIRGMTKKILAYQKKHSFDAIAFTGHSGAAVAYILSHNLSIPLICIRKNGSRDHYGQGVYEGRKKVKRYIIVDDFIDTGATIKRIIKNVRAVESKAQLTAIFLYADSCSWPAAKGWWQYYHKQHWYDVPVFGNKP